MTEHFDGAKPEVGLASPRGFTFKRMLALHHQRYEHKWLRRIIERRDSRQRPCDIDGDDDLSSSISLYRTDPGAKQADGCP